MVCDWIIILDCIYRSNRLNNPIKILKTDFNLLTTILLIDCFYFFIFFLFSHQNSFMKLKMTIYWKKN